MAYFCEVFHVSMDLFRVLRYAISKSEQRGKFRTQANDYDGDFLQK